MLLTILLNASSSIKIEESHDFCYIPIFTGNTSIKFNILILVDDLKLNKYNLISIIGIYKLNLLEFETVTKTQTHIRINYTIPHKPIFLKQSSLTKTQIRSRHNIFPLVCFLISFALNATQLAEA